ncbi:hypothetical protein GCM10023238_07130 [Streptomyces heliomycini]
MFARRPPRPAAAARGRRGPITPGHARTPAAPNARGPPASWWTGRDLDAAGLPWEGGRIADRDAPVGLVFRVPDAEGLDSPARFPRGNVTIAGDGRQLW